MKRVILGLVVLLLVVTPTPANITIPWENNDYGTFQEWASTPGAGLVLVVDENPYGTPTAVIGSGPGPGGQVGWVELTIPNVVALPLKIVQMEMIYHGATTGYDLVAQGSTVAKTFSNFINLPGDHIEENVTWMIDPQPPIEWIYITWSAGSPPLFDSIEVATICVPAPGAVLLASIGVGLVGWLRGRRLL